MPFLSRVPSLLAALGVLSVCCLHAQTCTYGYLDHTSPDGWRHQLCVPPTFITAPLAYSAAGTYSSQYLGALQGGSLNGTASATANLVGMSAGVTVTNVTLSTKAPSQVTQGGLGLYLYGDVRIDPTAAAGTAGLLMHIAQEGVQVMTAVDTLQVLSATAEACQQDVTSQLQVTSTPAVPMFNTQLYTQVVTLKNMGGTDLKGPVLLGLRNLSANAQLFAGNGPLPCGANAGVPYQFAGNGLASGASTRVVLTFTNSLVPQAAVAYQPVVLAGF